MRRFRGEREAEKERERKRLCVCEWVGGRVLQDEA